MELLEAVNNILPYFGEAPVTRIDNKHPTVTLITNTIDTVRKTLLAEGWWFNERHVTLYPSTEGGMPAPSNALSIEGLDGKVYEMRGRAIFNVGTGSFIFTDKIEVKVLEDIKFEDLPRTVAQWITCRSASRAYAMDFGIEDVIQEMQMREQEAYNKMLAEHLRKRKYCTWKSKAGVQYLSALQG